MNGGEKRGVRETIDRMIGHLIASDLALAREPARAREIATGAALRVAHGEKKPTEAPKR